MDALRRTLIVACSLLLVLIYSGRFAQGEDLPQLERIPPQEPASAMQSFDVLPGVQLDLVAAEPLVVDPVAMAFDESGRLYVIEMCDYSEQDKDFLGKVRLLEDVDGDGKYEKSTLFADRLSWPTAIACYDGGVFVGAAPDIYYLKDTNGDGRSDEKKVVFTGFRRTNVQGLLNSFQWGPDNRIYGATSSCGGEINSPEHPERRAVNCRNRDFSFDPRTLDFRTESGGAQHGLSFDDWGRRFVCSNGDHLQMILFADRYGARNPAFAMPPARVSIAADGPQAEVFRLSPVEAWRELRTQWRATGKAKGPVEAGGKSSGYFTSATGVTIYRGDALPEEFRGQAFVADVGSNIIHRKQLEPKGPALVGKRIDQNREIVASKDIWFRPVQFANAPDGSLFIADMYRETIEHPQAIPPELKSQLDLTSGRDRGRIYRLIPPGFQQPKKPHLATATTAELVAALAHRNGWYRDTAARLLYERQPADAVPLLEQLANDSEMPEARMHALYALQGLKALSPQTVLRSLSDADPHVREHAILLAESMIPNSPEICEKLTAMTSDTDPRVQLQLAFTLGALPVELRAPALANLVKAGAQEPLVQAAVLSSLNQGASQVLAQICQDATFGNHPANRLLVQKLAALAARQGGAQDVARVENCLAAIESEQPLVAAAIVRGLATRTSKKRGKAANELSPNVLRLLEKILASSRSVAADDSKAMEDRVDAIRTLALGNFAEQQEVLSSLFDNRFPQPIQLAAVETLGNFTDRGVADILIDAWPGMTPRVRSAASDVLFSRPVWTGKLFDALDTETIPQVDIDVVRVHVAQTSRDKDVRNRANLLAAKMKVAGRTEVIEHFRSALSKSGDPEKGKQLFVKTCSACHQLEGVGNAVGPNLAAFKSRGAEAIYLNVLDPNREVNPQYVNYQVRTHDGKVLTGMIANENDSAITLVRGDNAQDTLQKSEIEELRSSGQSLMPEGLEKQFDEDGLADLIAYILSTK